MDKFFALGLSEHRIWGLILIPMMLKKEEDNSFFKPDHTIFPDEKDENFLLLSNTEKKIVRIIDEYNDQNLYKIFSKHRSVKEFQEKIRQENIENFIRPYIEKHLLRVFEIVRGTRIKIFLREKTRKNIFDEDFLNISEKEIFPVFSFTRSEEESSYNLQLYSRDGKISLLEKSYDLITRSPAILRLNNNLIFVKDIEATKLKPFFSKEKIIIPKKTEKQYFKSFAKKIIQNYEVKSEGFDIHQIEPEKKTIVSLERSIQNKAVLVLNFLYGKRKIYGNYEQKVFVDFHQKGDSFYFDKYKRDDEWEQEFHGLLTDCGLRSFDQVNYENKESRDLPYHEQVNEMVEWLNRNADELTENGIRIEQRIENKQFFTGKKGIKINSSLEKDWFDMYAEISCGDYRFPLIRLKKNILDMNREYVLPDGSIFIIPSEWFGRFKELFEFSKIENEKIRIHKQHFFIIEKAEKGSRQNAYAELKKLSDREHLPSTVIPSALQAKLRNYQEDGFKWLWYLQQNNLGGCLADDMGLGKTLQAICLLLKNKEIFKSGNNESKNNQLDLFTAKDEKPTSLVVVPASLVHNWVNEVNRFAPSLKVYSHIGFQRVKKMNSFHYYDIIISSYHTVRQDIELISSFPFQYVILDESQVIKNPSSKLYRAMLLLNSKFRMVLTGTPIENSLTDLWAQLNFINNGLLGSLNFFKKEYVYPVEKKNDDSREQKLKELINPFILRRTKEEVAKELPDMTEQVILCNMTDEQRKFYDEEKSTIRRGIFEKIERDGLTRSSMIVLQGLTRLRQISNHPVLVDENYRDDSGKFSEIIRNIDSIISENHKVLVFSSFVKHLNIVGQRLDKENIGYTLLTGESTNREKIVRDFQNNDNSRVFLISLKAGGVGLNLTAADYVFILDPWWNPASEEQAINRAHRIGQDKNVFVYRFISENSIEEKIQKLQARKNKLAETFVKSNNPMKEISRKDLEELFN